MKYKHFVWFYLSMGKILCGTQAQPKFENILSFSQKRSPGGWKKLFQVFFHVTIYNIIEELLYIFAYFGSFWVKMEKNPTLSLNYERIRIFWGKRTLRSWSINTLCDSICIWGKSYVGPRPPSNLKIFCHFLKRGHREVEKNFFKFFSCYYV